MENLQQEPKKEDTPKSKQRVVGILMLEAGTEFAFLIAVPLIVFILLGKKLDAHYHTKFLVLVGIFLGLITSSVAIWKRINDYKKLLK